MEWQKTIYPEQTVVARPTDLSKYVFTTWTLQVEPEWNFNVSALTNAQY